MQLRAALREAQLAGLEDQLDIDVAEGGANLSMGQKQCISLARVFLWDPSIVLLDEATASVDLATDELLQTALRKSPALASKTVVVIAHRLQTIMDSDQVIVMRDGKIVDAGRPQNLAASGGAFSTLLGEPDCGEPSELRTELQ